MAHVFDIYVHIIHSISDQAAMTDAQRDKDGPQAKPADEVFVYPDGDILFPPISYFIRELHNNKMHLRRLMKPRPRYVGPSNFAQHMMKPIPDVLKKPATNVLKKPATNVKPAMDFLKKHAMDVMKKPAMTAKKPAAAKTKTKQKKK